MAYCADAWHSSLHVLSATVLTVPMFATFVHGRILTEIVTLATIVLVALEHCLSPMDGQHESEALALAVERECRAAMSSISKLR